MTSLTLEQAARASGRSARELRLLLEEGRLRGGMQAGRWRVEPSEVDGLVAEATAVAAPVEPQLSVVPPSDARSADAPPPGTAPAVEELVSRLEQRAIEVARLRGELEALREGRDEHGARVERELSGLRRELADSREECRHAYERTAELEARLAAAERAGADRREEPDDRPATQQPRRPGMSEALSPLFRPT